MSKPTQTIDFNFDWRFLLEDDPAFSEANHDDSAWRSLQLPHDWSVEHAFDESLEGATGYLPGGIAWYRKTFTSNEQEALTSILFDGVYNNASFWINGTKLGDHPYGYSPALYDLSNALHTDGSPNVIAVRVDHSHYGDSRWYTGSGIYRNVELITKPRVQIPTWGVFITTPSVSSDQATVAFEIKTANRSEQDFKGILKTDIVNPDGTVVGTVETTIQISAGATIESKLEVSLDNPALWHIGQPNLYTAVTAIVAEDGVIDTAATKFGIREFRFEVNEGFFLNGENLLIKGVCLHHDGGLVGAAVPKGVWKRRLEKLVEMGCNAIRSAHNPPSAEFLELCDEMGLLVQNEFFDEWDNPKDKRKNMQLQDEDHITQGYTHHFQEWAQHDLEVTMLRDRNHPCIIQWSIGNEIEWTYDAYPNSSGYFEKHGNWDYFFVPPLLTQDEVKARYDAQPKAKYTLEGTAEKLAKWTRALDTTRPVTANCVLPIVSHVTGYCDVLDIVGYSYRKPIYSIGHEQYPERPVMGTENVGQWQEWKEVLDRPYISGIFVWTGIDYMGESDGLWPRKASPCGFLDTAGFEKAGFHVYRTLWREDDPFVHMSTQTLENSIYKLSDEGRVLEKEEGAWKRRLWEWHDVNYHWNYKEDELCIVEIASNCFEVELFENGRSLGRQKLEDQADRFFKWSLPFQTGTLEAIGFDNQGKEQYIQVLETSTEPVGIEVEVDHVEVKANGYDVVHVTVQLVDLKNNPVKHIDELITFVIDGPCRMLGVDNGSARSVQSFQKDCITTAQGRALLILQTEKTQGTITITAKTETLVSPTKKVGVTS